MSVGKAMSLNDFRKYLQQLRNNLVGHKGAAVRGIHSGVMKSIPVVHQATMNAPPASLNGSKGAFNTGAYLQGWQYELHATGGRVYNSRRHAPIIEDGRRRGAKRPPVREIELWAKRKLGLRGKQLQSAKYAIANAIAKRGLRPRRVLRSSEGDIRRVVMEEIRFEVRAALRAGGHIK